MTVPSDESTVREIERALGTRLERRRLPDFDYGVFVPERQPATYPSSPQRGNYNARSMNRGPSNGGGQRQAGSYNTRQAVPSSGNGGESNGNGRNANNGGGANRRRRSSGRYLQR